MRRSAHPAERPAIFAAQLALSHDCWLLTYPLAGWLGWVNGLGGTVAVRAGFAALGVALALRLWPSHDPETFAHGHDHLRPGIRI